MNQVEKTIHTVEFYWEETVYYDIIDNYDVPPLVRLGIPLSKEEYKVVENNEDEFKQFCIYKVEEIGEDELLERGYFTENPEDYIYCQLWEFMEKHTN